MGMTREAWLKGRPPLERDNEIALKVWAFCAGWNPAVLPMAAAYYQVDDVDLLTAQLLAIRDCVEAHEKAQRAHGQRS